MAEPVTTADLARMVANYLVPAVVWYPNRQSLQMDTRATMVADCLAAGMTHTADHMKNDKTFFPYWRLHMTGMNPRG